MKKWGKKSELVRSLEKDLIDGKRPIIADRALSEALGYASMAAFRQALCRNTVPVPVFSVRHRRGKYALVEDVARWLAEQRLAAEKAQQRKPINRKNQEVM